MSESPKFHPAFAVTNVKNITPFLLESESSQYSTWAELFQIHCRAYDVIDHILPPAISTNDKGKEKVLTDEEKARWSRLDSIVLTWIYGTITNELLQTVFQPKSTASQVWSRIEEIFQDNKPSRALYLERHFSQIRLDDFANVSSYCQELKVTADLMANVDAAVSEQRLALQLIAGLNDNYGTVATMLQQTKPLPSFYDARSRLALEESRKNEQTSAATKSADAAFIVAPEETAQTRSHKPPAQNRSSGSTSKPNKGRGTGNRGGRNSSSSQGRGRDMSVNTNGAGRGYWSQGTPPWNGCAQYPPYSFPPWASWA